MAQEDQEDRLSSPDSFNSEVSQVSILDAPPVREADFRASEPIIESSALPADIAATASTPELATPLEESEEWELDFEEHIHAGSEIRDWSVLREQIKTDLKKQKNKLSLTQINQLLVVQNFATLRLKGYLRIPASEAVAQQWHRNENPVYFARKVRALARHYQLFEQLPIEKRGGNKNSRSLLDDPTVRSAARDWLTAQKAGDVTPSLFQRSLNMVILPTLGINLKKPLCERTARRWLVKLGWRLTVIRKGVYMDGHERADVVEYRNKVFLPKMAELERRMVHFEGPDLERVEPVLAEGEKEVVLYYHDESSLQQNDHKSQAW
jgi:hypothetical protein